MLKHGRAGVPMEVREWFISPHDAGGDDDDDNQMTLTVGPYTLSR